MRIAATSARVAVPCGASVVAVRPLMRPAPTAHCIASVAQLETLEASVYFPIWIDGKKHARNVYAHTREECEEKLKVLIAEMKAELAELKRQKTDKH